jgi:hypothetical protein
MQIMLVDQHPNCATLPPSTQFIIHIPDGEANTKAERAFLAELQDLSAGLRAPPAEQPKAICGRITNNPLHLILSDHKLPADWCASLLLKVAERFGVDPQTEEERLWYVRMFHW